MSNLKNLLDDKKCFKLICGAGNENLEEVEKLVALYAKAGCHFFDLKASEEVLKAAQKGLSFAIPKEAQYDYHFCISIGTSGDQHVQKASIESEKCINCAKCVEICPQNAIMRAGGQDGKKARIEIIEKYCIGCKKCVRACPQNIIDMIIRQDLACLPALLASFPLSCIELHASDINELEVDEIWNEMKNFNGMISLCLGREKLSNEKILNRIQRLIKDRKPYTTIIQADGSPMSGGEDDFKTTLQAVAMAEVIQNAKLPVYVLLSGGTNSKTAELANLCGVDFNGVGVGSYARKIVKEYIEREDFWSNEAIFEEASKIASNLIRLSIP